jgi:hypothetical protein
MNAVFLSAIDLFFSRRREICEPVGCRGTSQETDEGKGGPKGRLNENRSNTNKSLYRRRRKGEKDRLK